MVAAAPSADSLAAVTALDWQAGRQQDGKPERRGVIGLGAATGSLRGGTRLAGLVSRSANRAVPGTVRHSAWVVAFRAPAVNS